MGLASLILGIIGLILAFIPGCGMFLAIIPINLGIIFGIIGVITEKGKRGKAIIGLSLSGLFAKSFKERFRLSFVFFYLLECFFFDFS